MFILVLEANRKSLNSVNHDKILTWDCDGGQTKPYLKCYLLTYKTVHIMQRCLKKVSTIDLRDNKKNIKI